MTLIRESTLVDAPVDEVWSVVSDPRNLPSWNKHIVAVHDLREDGLEPGTRYWTEIVGAGVQFRVRAHVEELDPPRYSRIRLSGPIDAVVQTWVHPAGRRRSRLEHQVDYHLHHTGPLDDLIGRALRVLGATALLRRGIRAQKKQVEAG
ncbi:MAG: SRPBCC family protein [Actinomycetota bacterium]